MESSQQTLKGSVELAGTGLFFGKPVSLCLNPAPVNSGIRFVRTDLPGRPAVIANANSIANDTRRVLLKNEEAEVEGIEHLMACLAGLRIDNVEIELDAREMPACDGSGRDYLNLINKVGLVKQDAQKRYFEGKNSVVISDGNASISLIPGNNGLHISYSLGFNGYDFDDSFSISLTDSNFMEQIAPARTFGLFENISKFKELGIGNGITDDNTIIVHKSGVTTKPLSMAPANLRFANECTRHKVLDLIGDLYLSNLTIRGHIIARRSGHFLNIRMARKLIEISAVA